jgi:hypothetical protein
MKDGFYTIVLVNSHYASYKDLLLKADSLPALLNVKKYIYLSGDGSDYTGLTDSNGFPLPETENMTLDLVEGIKLDMLGQSVIVFTNFPY